MHKIFNFSLHVFRGDLYGGITAAVVALPLALAFGVASGAGPIAGLYGAIFVGFFASLFGGTPSQISGPTGPMTVVIATIFITFADDPGTAVFIIILGGVFQILFGVFKLGDLIRLVPFTVISGFMSGIGVIIIILQIPPLLGHASSSSSVLNTALEIPSLLSVINIPSLVIGIIVLAIVIFLPQRINQILPAPLLALVTGTLLVLLVFPDVKTLDQIPTGFPKIQLPVFNVGQLTDIVGWAFVLAMLGSIDSLLTSLIADSITRTHHRSNKELVGQGIGNIVAGLFGSIPGAGATMRTLINVRAGGSTPLSGIIHAFVLLAIALGLGPLASHIPHTVLAGILIKVGIDIIDWKYLKHLRHAPRAGMMIMAIVLFLTVFVDLIIAFSAGMIIASLLFLKRMTDHQLNTVNAAHEDQIDSLDPQQQNFLDVHSDDITYFEIGGPLSFGAAKDVSRRITPNANHRFLILDLKQVPTIDTTGAYAIEDIITNSIDLNVDPILILPESKVKSVLQQLGVLSNNKTLVLVETLSDAIDVATDALTKDSATIVRLGSAHES